MGGRQRRHHVKFFGRLVAQLCQGRCGVVLSQRFDRDFKDGLQTLLGFVPAFRVLGEVNGGIVCVTNLLQIQDFMDFLQAIFALLYLSKNLERRPVAQRLVRGPVIALVPTRAVIDLAAGPAPHHRIFLLTVIALIHLKLIINAI